MQVWVRRLGGVRSGNGEEEQDRGSQEGAHGRNLRRHRHGHQALRENPQD